MVPESVEEGGVLGLEIVVVVVSVETDLAVGSDNEIKRVAAAPVETGEGIGVVVVAKVTGRWEEFAVVVSTSGVLSAAELTVEAA